MKRPPNDATASDGEPAPARVIAHRSARRLRYWIESVFGRHPPTDHIVRAIRLLDYEEMHVFSAGGRRLFARFGSAVAVAPTTEQVLTALAHDLLIVHNHPPNRSFPVDDPRWDGGWFSSLDLRFLPMMNPRVLRVVSQRWVHTLERTRTDWFLADADELERLYLDLEVEAIAAIRRAIRAGDRDETAFADLAHETKTRVAAWYGSRPESRGVWYRRDAHERRQP